MAAVAYPYLGARPAPRQDRVRRPHPHLRLVETPPPCTRPGRRRHRLPLIGVLAMLVAAWFAVGALAAPRPAASSPASSSPAAPGGAASSPAASPAPSGNVPVRYTVRSGDTLWSIALRIDPSGDPWPLVDELAAELHGRPLEPGTTLVLP